jgi:hypothetical protein
VTLTLFDPWTTNRASHLPDDRNMLTGAIAVKMGFQGPWYGTDGPAPA